MDQQERKQKLRRRNRPPNRFRIRPGDAAHPARARDGDVVHVVEGERVLGQPPRPLAAPLIGYHIVWYPLLLPVPGRH